MFSLQKLLGQEDKFFDLLEASAQEARTSVDALVRADRQPKTKPPSLTTSSKRGNTSGNCAHRSMKRSITLL